MLILYFCKCNFHHCLQIRNFNEVKVLGLYARNVQFLLLSKTLPKIENMWNKAICVSFDTVRYYNFTERVINVIIYSSLFTKYGRQLNRKKCSNREDTRAHT